MTKLREMMQKDLQIKGYGVSTQTAYLKHIEKYAVYFKKSPDGMGADEIKEYLNYLIISKKVSHSYIKTAYSALKFFMKQPCRETGI